MNFFLTHTWQTIPCKALFCLFKSIINIPPTDKIAINLKNDLKTAAKKVILFPSQSQILYLKNRFPKEPCSLELSKIEKYKK